MQWVYYAVSPGLSHSRIISSIIVGYTSTLEDSLLSVTYSNLVAVLPSQFKQGTCEFRHENTGWNTVP